WPRPDRFGAGPPAPEPGGRDATVAGYSTRPSARSTFIGVIGRSVTRTPIAFATALAIAAAVGMIGGSPTPFTPRLLATGSGMLTASASMSGTIDGRGTAWAWNPSSRTFR